MKKQKALILGLGISGKAAQELLEKEGWETVGIDDRCKSPLIRWSEISLFVPSPGVHPEHPMYQKAIALGIETVGEAELGLARARCRAIGITGTNGKSTAVALITHVLKEAGRRAVAMGNIGNPICKEIPLLQPDDVAVIELSSFQLETAKTKALDAAAILTISEDHLDRYPSYRDYAKTKLGIFSLCKPNGQNYLPVELVDFYGELLQGVSYRRVSYQKPEFAGCQTTLSESSLAICFATLDQFGVGLSTFTEAVKTFPSLAHRLEYVASVAGIECYNDSKSTNAASTAHAVQKLGGSIILIAGGRAKEGGYVSWQTSVAPWVKAVIVIGEARGEIALALKGFVDTYEVADLASAVKLGLTVAEKKDRILLSPGCASFDQFRDYKDRGETFKRLIAINSDKNVEKAYFL